MNKTFRRTLKVKMFIVVVLGLLTAVISFFAGMLALDTYVANVYMQMYSSVLCSRSRALPPM